MDFKMTKQTQVRSIEEALKLALEALTHFEKAGLATLKTVDAITTIREALAEHPAQTDWEAVAADQAMTIALLRAEQPAQRKPWVGLTDEEIISMSRYDLEYAALIGEVQRKLKEKNSD